MANDNNHLNSQEYTRVYLYEKTTPPKFEYKSENDTRRTYRVAGGAWCVFGSCVDISDICIPTDYS